jgi:septal ring factor EnvC (AmiA/AmiB activator)
MAATPTELLAVAAQRLEESNQRIVARIDGLEKTVNVVRSEFAAFRSRLNTIVAISCTAALFLLSLTTLLWTGVSSLQRELGRTEATIANQDKRFDDQDKRSDEVRDALKGIGERLNRVSEDLARLQRRLDRDGSSSAPKAKGNGE